MRTSVSPFQVLFGKKSQMGGSRFATTDPETLRGGRRGPETPAASIVAIAPGGRYGGALGTEATPLIEPAPNQKRAESVCAVGYAHSEYCEWRYWKSVRDCLKALAHHRIIPWVFRWGPNAGLASTIAVRHKIFNAREVLNI